MEEFDDHNQIDDWSDWLEPEAQAMCLFCEFQSSQPDGLAQHMSSEHNFDFLGLKDLFTIYQQIKIVNYVRRQVHERKCIFCDVHFDSREQLIAHMQEAGHFKLPDDRSVWDQSQWVNNLHIDIDYSEVDCFPRFYRYYFPTYENDALLCLLEDAKGDDESTEADQVIILLIFFARIKELMRFENVRYRSLLFRKNATI